MNVVFIIAYTWRIPLYQKLSRECSSRQTARDALFQHRTNYQHHVNQKATIHYSQTIQDAPIAQVPSTSNPGAGPCRPQAHKAIIPVVTPFKTLRGGGRTGPSLHSKRILHSRDGWGRRKCSAKETPIGKLVFFTIPADSHWLHIIASLWQWGPRCILNLKKEKGRWWWDVLSWVGTALGTKLNIPLF